MRSARQNLKFLDDLARVASGAMGSFSEVKGQVKSLVRETVDKVMGEMDMVTRAEFEDLQAVAQKARQRQEELEKRLAALEKKQAPAKASATGPKKKKTIKGKKT